MGTEELSSVFCQRPVGGDTLDLQNSPDVKFPCVQDSLADHDFRYRFLKAAAASAAVERPSFSMRRPGRFSLLPKVEAVLS